MMPFGSECCKGSKGIQWICGVFVIANKGVNDAIWFRMLQSMWTQRGPLTMEF